MLYRHGGTVFYGSIVIALKGPNKKSQRPAKTRSDSGSMSSSEIGGR